MICKLPDVMVCEDCCEPLRVLDDGLIVTVEGEFPMHMDPAGGGPMPHNPGIIRPLVHKHGGRWWVECSKQCPMHLAMSYERWEMACASARTRFRLHVSNAFQDGLASMTIGQR